MSYFEYSKNIFQIYRVNKHRDAFKLVDEELHPHGIAPMFLKMY